MSSTFRNSSIFAIKKALVAGYPIIAIDSLEEDQVEIALQAIFKSVFPQGGRYFSYDAHTGLSDQGRPVDLTNTLESAFDRIHQAHEPGFFVFKDVFQFLEQPGISRRLQNIGARFRGQNSFLILLGRDIHLHPDVRKEIHVLAFGLPDLVEIQDIVDRNITQLALKGVENRLDPQQLSHAAVSLQGFSSNEVQHILNKVFWGQKVLDETLLNALQNEKEQLTRQESVLEFVRTQTAIDDVGGLQNLKTWLIQRQKLFTPEARDKGIDPPKGLLMMGISGCGKSLAVKAVSSLWQLPLFRLDMNQMYSGTYGTPEATFHRAIRSIESVAPAILWIDEIEGGISSNNMKDGGQASHIFSAFLTWMQEKSSQIFVAATANRIDLLPAEILRKGRFDQIFFIDLPNDREREEIFKVHLLKKGCSLESFDLPFLSVATEFWNGAEIEHVVKSAMIEAFYRGTPLVQDDLYNIIRNTVPLARTMAEQIKFIKNWASERAISASISEKASGRH